MLVSVYYKLSLFDAHAMILIFHIFMTVNKLCLNQETKTQMRRWRPRSKRPKWEDEDPNKMMKATMRRWRPKWEGWQQSEKVKTKNEKVDNKVRRWRPKMRRPTPKWESWHQRSGRPEWKDEDQDETMKTKMKRWRPIWDHEDQN